MLKINDLLDKTSKTVSSVAVITLGLAIIAGSAVSIKENVKALFGRRLKAVICVKKHDPAEEHEEKDASKSSKKQSSKKPVSKNEKPDLKEPKLETVE